jgi:superoxide dismutase
MIKGYFEDRSLKAFQTYFAKEISFEKHRRNRLKVIKKKETDESRFSKIDPIAFFSSQHLNHIFLLNIFQPNEILKEKKNLEKGGKNRKIKTRLKNYGNMFLMVVEVCVCSVSLFQ